MQWSTKVTGAPMYFVSHFWNEYIETGVILKSRSKWIHLANLPAATLKLQYVQ